MKKVFTAVLALAILMTLAACGSGESTQERQGSGFQSNQTTVSDILDAAANGEKETETAPAQEAAKSAPQESAAPSSEEGVDVDLTQLLSVMIYSEVSNMMYDSEEYFGKVVRMKGYAASTYYDVTGETYYAVIIPDATACCSQGIEYLLRDGFDYPEDGAEVTVTGVFSEYEELGVTYLRLDDAQISA